MFEIGSSLREARMRRGLSTEDVQKALRIRDRYLYALEEERWELLPGDAYVKGFLRTYAEFLGLDGNLYIDEYTARFAGHENEPFLLEPMGIVHAPRVGILRPLIAIGSIVAIVGSVAAWQLQRSPAHVGRAADTTSGTPSAKPAITPTPAPKPAVVQPTKATLSATRGRVWLQLRTGGKSGAVIFEGVLEQGKTLPVDLSKQTVWLRVGAPWNLDVTIGGKVQSGLPTQPGDVEITPRGVAPAA